MRPLGFLDDARVERSDVVGAEKTEGGRVCKGQVEERFVPVALGELRVVAPVPDRLTDPADRLPAGTVLVDELVPRCDDPRRVRAHLRHVGEKHPVGVLAERLTETVDLVGVQDDEDRLAGLDAAPNELNHPSKKLVRAPVEERLVDESWTWWSTASVTSVQSHGASVPGRAGLKPRPNGAREQEAVVLLVAALDAVFLGERT